MREIIIKPYSGKGPWKPPSIRERELADSIREKINCNTDYFYIFKIEPYIDAIYIEFGKFKIPESITRFTFHEDYVWNNKREEFFWQHCVKNIKCEYDKAVLKRAFDYYAKAHPGWKLCWPQMNELRLLDNIYGCMNGDVAKAILYNSGLDELAANVNNMDELNLLAENPSDLYEGISIGVLSNLNCAEGAKLIANHERREFIKKLNATFPDILSEKLNDAHCKYIIHLYNEGQDVYETGRQFLQKKAILSGIWSRDMFNIFLQKNSV